MQQQTIGKVGIHLYVCGQIISVCNSERLKSDSICESYAEVFLNLLCRPNKFVELLSRQSSNNRLTVSLLLDD